MIQMADPFRDVRLMYEEAQRFVQSLIPSNDLLANRDNPNIVPVNSHGEIDYNESTKRLNEATDGYYTTVVNGIPIVRDMHNALLDRQRTLDYMDNNGLSWSDIQSYNLSKIQSPTAVSSLISQGANWLKNNSNDLGKLYSQQV